ncbi:cytochrome P450 [Nocardia sp. BMG51109]|uniref:cytochrome P450 n=1 Tax=Nocardia sp. BMG51109 TaxID=1056816 RepID=UPI0004639691|nr:cytochrome P450 [Nocardia sp. BMG51109]
MPASVTRATALAPGGVPGLGHAWMLRTDPIGLFASLRPYGDIVQIKIGPQRVYVITSTELTHELLVSKYRAFDKGVAVENFRDVFGFGLLSSEGELHRRHRLLLQPAFHPDRLADYLAIMRTQILYRIESWRDGQVLEARSEMSAITLAVVAKALISADVGDELAAEVQLRLPRLLDLSYRRAVGPLPVLNRFPLPRNREYAALVARLHPMIDEVIADYRRNDTRRPDLLSMMLDARDADGAMPDERIHDQIMTFLLAGSETTATALSWTFLRLSENPDVSARVSAEIDEVLGSAAGGPEYADLHRLGYTARVVDESLRHSPPIWLITRRAIENVELGGYLLPGGSSVMLSPYLTGHDPALITEPDRFDPDRWSRGDATRSLRQAAQPFGAGPRKCIGDSFATTETLAALATILSRWQLRQQPGTTVTPRAHQTYYPGGLRLVVTERARPD